MSPVAAATLATATTTPAAGDGFSGFRSRGDNNAEAMPYRMMHPRQSPVGRSAAACASGRRRHRLARGHVADIRLDDHAARPLGEQVGGGGADALLAGRSVDRRPVDDVAADAFGFFDQRRPWVARADQARADLDPGAPRLDAGGLQHGAPAS